MPIIKSAKKKLRADAKKRAVNIRTKRQLSSVLKKFEENPTNATLKEVYSALDTAAKKNIIPKGRADRKKSRLSAKVTKKSTPKESSTTSIKKPSKSTRKTV